MGATLARAHSHFHGVIALVGSNQLAAMALLRGHLEVLATTAYVRRYPDKAASIFASDRPRLEKRMQVLVREWDESAREINRFLTDHAHFNHSHHRIQRVSFARRAQTLVSVFGDDEQLIRGILTALAEVSARQILELQALSGNLPVAKI